MAVSKRIRFFRKLRGMTQKRLGAEVGFPEKSADTRVAQYETDARGPKAALRERFACALGVSVNALAIPDVDGPDGLMHTLFVLEDLYGFRIVDSPEGLCLQLNELALPRFGELRQSLEMWYTLHLKMEAGLLPKTEYDQWRYNYPNAIYGNNEVNHGI